MISFSFNRVWAMMLRYIYLHRRSISRTLEIFFWPIMELLVWGYVTLYIRQISGDATGKIFTSLISGMIFWDLLYRSQQGVSVSIIEDMWTHNISNLLASPLRISEWLMATFLYGFIKTTIITVILGSIAIALYQFNLFELGGFLLLPLMANLLLFGWAIGMITASFLLRWGHAVEALIWGIPFLLQPLSAIFYPLSVLPAPIQFISKLLPSTYLFEGMRALVKDGVIPNHYLTTASLLNIFYFLLAAFVFNRMYQSSRESGKLARLGTD